MRTKSQTAWAVSVLIGLTLITGSWAEDRPAAAAAAAAAIAATTGSAPPPSVTVLGSKQAQSVLGKEVRSAANEDMGRIVDVIVDRAGQVRAAVIDFGGFLGVGSRKIAVDWNALRFSTDSSKRPEVITLELTRDQVKGAPEYKDKRAVIVLGAAGGLRTLPE
jgi:hypothetical protein